MGQRLSEQEIAARLADLYEVGFGGKNRGRYRISMKYLRMLAGRNRVSPEAIRKISEELFEFGFVLIDLETYFVVLAQNTFRGYRRVAEGCLSGSPRPSRGRYMTGAPDLAVDGS
jgi:hypothetical protein